MNNPTNNKRTKSQKKNWKKKQHKKDQIHANFTRGNHKANEGVHPGSFAHADMRALFGVQLPQYQDPQLVTSATAMNTNDNNNDNDATAETPEQSTITTSTTDKNGEATTSDQINSNAQQQDSQQQTESSSPSDNTTNNNNNSNNNNNLNNNNNNDDEASSSTPKRVKRKVAFLIAYLGTNYTGFQINKNQRTLQAEIELALYKAHLLTNANFGHTHKYSWSTSGRTDKGVHACAQVCSAKIELPTGNEQPLTTAREAMNAVLPPDIRILDVQRVARSFCAKTERDQVRYQYMIPSFALTDTAQMRAIFQQAGNVHPDTDSHRPPGNPLTPQERQAIQQHLSQTRITPNQLEKLQHALQAFVGTRSHHNYSKGVGNDEPRSNRYIVSWTTEDPIVFDNNEEWIPTQVVGQSFLLHQIRKMVGRAMDVVRGAVTMETLEAGFDRSHTINIPPAPAQGLYLDMSYYTRYNVRKTRKQVDVPDLDWTHEDSPVYPRWHDFRNRTLMPHLVQQEAEEGNFLTYLYQQEFVNGHAARGTGIGVTRMDENNEDDEEDGGNDEDCDE